MALLTLSEGSAAHRAYRLSGWAIAVALLVYVPWFAGTPARVDLYSQAVALAVALLGLNMLVGYSGQISLGHSAFVGLGAYATVILVADHGWPFLATLPIAFVLCFLVGLAVGLPATRLSGLYLAVVTLSVAASFPIVVNRFDELTGGPNGKLVDGLMQPPAWIPLDAGSRFGPAAYRYFVILAVAALMFWLAANLLNSRVGRALVAIGNNATSAGVFGVPVARYKTLMFGLSAAFAGVAGSLLMIQNPQATDTRFTVEMAVFLLVALFTGGTTTLAGAVPGALLYVFLPYYAIRWAEHVPYLNGRPGAGAISSVLYGVVLLVFVFFLPGGVGEGLRKLWARLVAVTPNPPWLRAMAAQEKRTP